MTTSSLSYLSAFLLALSLLTRLPVARVSVEYRPEDQRLAVLFYPLVGLILGGILWLVALAVSTLPAGLAAAILLACWILLTGAMHLDGLADAADGYFAGHACSHPDQRREKTLAVMRDPHCGAMAVVVLVIFLITKWAALTALFETAFLRQLQYLAVLLLLPRLALLPYLFTTRYARTQGLASALASDLPRVAICLVVFAGAALCLWLVPWQLACVMLLTAAAILAIWRHLWQSLIGGYTGDTLGGLVELLELALLILLLIAVRFWF